MHPHLRALRRWLSEQPQFVVLGILNGIILYWYFPEIQLASLYYNDGISHISIVRKMDEVWRSGGNIFDFWMGHVTFGHALLRSYQFFMHFFIWFASKTVFAPLSLEQAFNASITIFALALPWSFYASGRLLGLTRLEAIFAAIASVFIQETDSYGIGLHNFVFVGHGTYNQLLATIFVVLSFGLFHRFLKTGKGAVITGLCYAIAFMSHILTGYFALFWYLVEIFWMVFALRVQWRILGVRLLSFGAAVLAFTAHWLLPMMLDGRYQHRSVLENAYKWAGHGASKILSDFFSGRIFDDSPVPILTLFLFMGIAVLSLSFARSSTQKNRRYFFFQFLVALFISFGTATWGVVLGWLPFSNTVHWHRAFALLQMVGLFIIGIGIAQTWTWLRNLAFFKSLPASQRKLLIVLGCVVLLVGPIVKRQNLFRGRNVHWLNDTLYWKKNNPFIDASVSYALSHQDARYYVGRFQDHGQQLIVTSILPFYGLLTQYNLEMIGYLYHAQGHTSPLNVFFDWQKRSHLDLMNIGYVALKKEMPAPLGWKPILTSNNAILYSLPERFGYFWIGKLGPKGCADSEILHQSISDWLFSPLLDAHHHPEIDLQKNCNGKKTLRAVTAESAFHFAPEPLPGEISSSGQEDAPQSKRHWAKVLMREPGLLVFKMNFHPNWKVSVDGAPAHTKMILPALLGIELSAGEHSITVEYVPDPLKRTLQWMSLLIYVGLALYAIGKTIRKRAAQ